MTAIIKPRDPAVKARKVRAVLIDDRIRDHAHPSVRKLYGHEPWTDYSATLTDDRLGEAGAEMLDEIVDGVQRLEPPLQDLGSRMNARPQRHQLPLGAARPPRDLTGLFFHIDQLDQLHPLVEPQLRHL